MNSVQVNKLLINRSMLGLGEIWRCYPCFDSQCRPTSTIHWKFFAIAEVNY